MMKQTMVLVVALILSVCTASEAIGQKRSSKVNLNVAIDDSVALVGGIRSDAGTYTNGSGGVTAAIDEYGWFGMSTGPSRQITADYSNPLVIVAAGLPSYETGPASFRTFITSLKFQDMTVGTFQCVGAALVYSYNDAYGTERSVGYRRGDTDTAWVKVYRQDAATWILESGPQSDCSGSSWDGLARVRQRKTKGKTSAELVFGTYIMPFRMTLTRVP